MVIKLILSLILVLPITSYANGLDSLCDKLNEIKIIPFKGEHVDDEVYNQLLAKGDKSIKCLIEKSVDTTPMKDPRQAMPYEGFVVGDIAFFIFLDLTNTKLQDYLPGDVSDEYKSEGVYAYFKYVEKRSHRNDLKMKMAKWHSEQIQQQEKR